jgi:hypothetical protein
MSNPIISRALGRIKELETERDILRVQILEIMAREHLTCGWCGEMMSAPPGFVPPLTTETMRETVKLHIKSCKCHPIREVEADRDLWRAEAERWLQIHENHDHA